MIEPEDITDNLVVTPTDSMTVIPTITFQNESMTVLYDNLLRLFLWNDTSTVKPRIGRLPYKSHPNDRVFRNILFPITAFSTGKDFQPTVWKNHQNVTLRKFVGDKEVTDFTNRFATASTPLSFSVILVSMKDRLFFIYEHLRRWSGELIVVIYAKSTEESAILQTINSHSFPHRLTLLLYLYCENTIDSEHFPINSLRNLGIRCVHTSHFIIMDMDLWPSTNLYYELQHLPTHILNDPKSAIIVPIVFYNVNHILRHCDHFDDCIRLGFDYYPTSIDDLRYCVNKFICLFNKPHINTHGYTNQLWMKLAMEESPLLHLQCVVDHRQEPYYVVHHIPSTPMYDEDFIDYGYNKVQHMEHLRALNFHFYLLTHSFSVDMPHSQSEFRSKFMEQRGRGSKMVAKFAVFRDWLNKTYGMSQSLPFCKFEDVIKRGFHILFVNMNSVLVPPSHFAMLQEGLYRGVNPEKINLPFLESLQLKCIISLLPDGEPKDIKEFCEKRNIQHIHIDTEEYEVDCIPSKEEKQRVTSLLIDFQYYPLFFFGNKDSKIASVYVMLLRFVQRYHSVYIFKEFKKFGQKIDEDLKSIFDDLRISTPESLPSWLKRELINPSVLVSDSLVFKQTQ